MTLYFWGSRGGLPSATTTVDTAVESTFGSTKLGVVPSPKQWETLQCHLHEGLCKKFPPFFVVSTCVIVVGTAETPGKLTPYASGASDDDAGCSKCEVLLASTWILSME